MKKRLSLFVTGMVLSICVLTSCFKGGGNIQDVDTVGILTFSGKNFTPIIKTAIGNFASSALTNKVNQGDLWTEDCVWIYFRIDFDAPENALSVVEANGYYTVTLLADPYKIDKYYIMPFLSDTETALTDEYPVVKGYIGESVYLDDHFFMQHQTMQDAKLTLLWELGYDDAKTPTEENGRRYYDLYLRARKNSGDNSGSQSDKGYLNVYRMNNFMVNAAVKEKSLLGSSYNDKSSLFYVRINYVSSIDGITNAPRWEKETLDIPISVCLPD